MDSTCEMPSLNLDLDYFDHPKTRRLIGLLGRGAEVLPIRLWAYCGKFHFEDGRLTDYTEQEIETLVCWWGEPGRVVAALRKCGFLDDHGQGLQVHDWKQHQGHIKAYKDRAVNAAKIRWDATSIASRNATSIAKHCLDPAMNSNVLPCSENGNMDQDDAVGKDWESADSKRELTGKLCVFCGASEEMTGRPHQIEHFYPRVAGGTDAPENLSIACVPCNGAKQGRIFESVSDCRTWLHWRFWASSRQRYVKHRKYAFGGQAPTQSETKLGVELNQITVAQPDNSRLYGTSKNVEISTKARIALHWLNEKAGRKYRETADNLDLISRRLIEVDGDVEGIKRMIERQCVRWIGTEQQEYLRPDTLFCRRKFGSYYDNRDTPIVITNQSNGANRGKRPENPRNFGVAIEPDFGAKCARRVAEMQQEGESPSGNASDKAPTSN